MSSRAGVSSKASPRQKEGGLLEEAQTQAEAQLSQLFYAALGDGVTIDYAWRDAPVDYSTE